MSFCRYAAMLLCRSTSSSYVGLLLTQLVALATWDPLSLHSVAFVTWTLIASGMRDRGCLYCVAVCRCHVGRICFTTWVPGRLSLLSGTWSLDLSPPLWDLSRLCYGILVISVKLSLPLWDFCCLSWSPRLCRTFVAFDTGDLCCPSGLPPLRGTFVASAM